MANLRIGASITSAAASLHLLSSDSAFLGRSGSLRILSLTEQTDQIHTDGSFKLLISRNLNLHPKHRHPGAPTNWVFFKVWFEFPLSCA